MRLRRAEAVRYGDLAAAVVGDFDDRLTVVLGRNEAGKSTFTALIRHVLYGFPRGRTSERQYLPPGGESRVGRLVFDDDGVERLVERVEGPHGGRAVVHGPDGETAGETFLGPLTSGVSATVYQRVFGFSLEELSDLGSLADIQSRLYATTTGLRLNPHDVLEKLRADAEDVWAPRARTKKLHDLAAGRRKIRDERVRLEELADRFREDREARAVVAEELDGAERYLRTARHRHARLSALLGEARRCEERRTEHEQQLEEQQRSIDRLNEQLDELGEADVLLERAAAVDRLGSRLELFRSELEQVGRDRQRLLDMDAEIEGRSSELGPDWDLEALQSLKLGIEIESQLHEQEEILRAARRRRDDASRQAVDVRAERDVAVAAAEERSRSVDLQPGPAAAEHVAVRLEAIDRMLILGRQAEARAPSAFPGVAASVVAATLVVAGLGLEEPQILWAAAPPAALALALFMWSWLRRRVPAEISDLAELLGLEEQPSPAQLVELKSRLEDVRRAWLAAEAAGQAAEARQRAAELAEEAAAAADRKWKEWLRERRLGTASGDPAGAHGVLQLVRDLHGLVGSRRDIEGELARRLQVCEEFAAEAKELDGRIGNQDLVAVARGAETLVARLEAARESASQRRDLVQQLARAEEGRAKAGSRIEKNTLRIGEILAEAGLQEGSSLADLEALETVAREELSEFEKRRHELVEQRATLDGRLQRGATESGSSELRLAEAGIVERIDDALEKYAVAATAVDVLAEALQAFEAERQPAVIRRAQDLFSQLTDGRYHRIATPLGKFEPGVSGGEVVGRPPEKLSRSTAEQLFLALRLSYIENLAGAHEALPVLMDDVLVNFDERRRAAAAAAIGDFSSRRQVVFFTCHPSTVEAFASAVPDCSVIEFDAT